MRFWPTLFKGKTCFKDVICGTYSLKKLLGLSTNSIPHVRFEFRQVFFLTAVLYNSVPDGEHGSVSPKASACQQDSQEKVTVQIPSANEGDPVSIQSQCMLHIKELLKAGRLLDAIEFCRNLCRKQISISLTTYNLLLMAAARANDFVLSSLIFRELLNCHYPDSTSYSALAKSFLHVKDAETIRSFGRDFCELTFSGGATVMNRIILGFAETGQAEKALQIFEDMKYPDSKCSPDKITYNTILAILGKSGRMQKMQDEFDSMKECGLVPDIITYNTLVNSFRKQGRLDSCHVLVREMIERGIEPDLLTFTALIDGFGRLGHVEKALELFYEMKRRGIRLSIYVYRSLISVLKKSGNLQMAEKILEEMNAAGPNLVTSKDFKRNN
ncbi:pentatricopeptide repeat-containing protein At1g11900 isoform X2 [Nymphaea colorata]|uniref:pentatricopeptide repeat-containing protein At1g11900 isoform X2 n=1 Tax=Nymphaea colorata TaxID=210225 RepID=UPI00129E7877|nr:pentatricopeptide repeat-containing protein At1g11900 isoform X2 [Nymphaea colorata]